MGVCGVVDTERPGEERLFAAWFDQTNTPKAQSEIKHFAPAAYFFKQHSVVTKRHPVRRGRCFAVQTAALDQNREHLDTH